MRAVLTAAAIVMALPAAAHQTVSPVTNPNTNYLWLDAPNTTDAGSARMRIVFNGQEAAAALTPNQYWLYTRAYKRHLTHLSLRHGVHNAEGQARRQAFHDVVARYPNLRIEGFDFKRYYGNALITPDL